MNAIKRHLFRLSLVGTLMILPFGIDLPAVEAPQPEKDSELVSYRGHHGRHGGWHRGRGHRGRHGGWHRGRGHHRRHFYGGYYGPRYRYYGSPYYYGPYGGYDRGRGGATVYFGW